MGTEAAEVQASGGVVWRRTAAGRRASWSLVHRPRYDDWSLPKGMIGPHERRPEQVQRHARPVVEHLPPRRATSCSPCRWHCSQTALRRCGASRLGLTMVSSGRDTC